MLLGVDVGGTFTDAALIAADGVVHTAKVPSTPTNQSVGVLAACEAVLARADASHEQVERFAHGMTVATNALLERRVARAALVMTEGFTDVIELGRQARPHLYRLCEAPPPPLIPPELRFGAPERMGPEGPLRALDASAAAALADRLARSQPEAVAVVLLHSYAHPQHELELGRVIAARLPGITVTLSHELVGTFREYERAATTELDAALSPLLASYLRGLESGASGAGLPRPAIMQSSGGLADIALAGEHASLTVLSGPAGGVGGALELAAHAGERDVLCFDMGGTSCDVCLISAGDVAESSQRTIAGRPLALPSLDIHTVGAGGGSIAWRDPGGALRVGPRSAGAHPGPASYGLGGEQPTLTDANLLLGRLGPDAQLSGGLRLDARASARVVGTLAGELGLTLERCAEGIAQVAEAEMLRALQVMSVERGIDPRGLALMPFGGAGPLHACALAERLGIERILCPRASGVLCALGLAAAAPRRDAARTVMLAGERLTAAAIEQERERLLDRVRAQLPGPIERVRVRLELRYVGQSFELAVEGEEEKGGHATRRDLREAFERVHEERYGYRDEQSEIELVTIRVSAWAPKPRLSLRAAPGDEPAREPVSIRHDGRELDGEILRGELPPGTRLQGPALCALPDSTLLIASDWSGEVDEVGTIILTRMRAECRA